MGILQIQPILLSLVLMFQHPCFPVLYGNFYKIIDISIGKFSRNTVAKAQFWDIGRQTVGVFLFKRVLFVYFIGFFDSWLAFSDSEGRWFDSS